ncbi:AsmA family protein [Herminiimonas glaciei]|uniref:AsmA family protein n=1 Tax=Herminiimonas glaciei TaxID=523788 RepID=A0ABW2I868_9BURK
MRKWQKILLSVLAVVVLLLVLGGFALQRLTDSAHLTELARSSLKQSWNRDLTIGGLSLDLLPYPRLRARDVRISNPDWAKDKYLLQADEVRARLSLLPLLRGNVVVEGLLVKGLQLNLEVAADGRRSWEMPKTRTLRTSQFDLLALRADGSTINYRTPDTEIKRWRLERLRASGDSGLRNMAVSGRVVRGQYGLQFDGKLDDLSALGTPHAVSKGSLTLKSGETQASVTGQLPLDSGLQDYDFALVVDAASMKELYGFLQVDRASPVPLKASVLLQAKDGLSAFTDLKLQLGKLNLSGAGKWARKNERPNFDARLQADYIDMEQTFLDLGQAPLPEKKEGELFRDKPLAWPLLREMDGVDGKLDATIVQLKLRSGVEVANAQGTMTFTGDKLNVQHFSGSLLGGSATGDIVLEGKKQAVQLNLQLNDVSLGGWFKATGKKVAINGGAMKVDAKVHTSGASMKDLAAGLNGPVDIRIGSAQILSPGAGKAEFWLTGLFSTKDATRIDLACASGRLPFQSGVAKGAGIVGARSDVSQLLTSGEVNLRQQTVDLRGSVKVRSGFSLGLSNFSDGVKIAGPIGKPQLNIDESGTLGTIARIGAAILTSGVSIVATSIWDGANPKSDPCQVVFASRAVRKKNSN